MPCAAKLVAMTHAIESPLRGVFAQKKAAMTLSELEEWLAVFITQVYHQRVHNEVRTSPIKRYEEGLLGTKDRPRTGLPHRVLDEDRTL
jgi:putative transposase